MKPEPKSSPSCMVFVLVAAVILVPLLIGLGLMAMLFLNLGSAEQQIVLEEYPAQPASFETHDIAVDMSRESSSVSPPRNQALILDLASWPVYSPGDVGEELTARQFVAIMKDSNATTLQRTTFHDAAQNAPVTWLLQLSEVTDKDGELEASFWLSYQIRTGSHVQYEQIPVTGKFDEQARDALMKLRKQAWVNVHGQLTFDLNLRSVVIENPRIASEATAER